MSQQQLFNEPAKKPENTCGKCKWIRNHPFSTKLKYCMITLDMTDRSYKHKVKSRDRACSAFAKK